MMFQHCAPSASPGSEALSSTAYDLSSGHEFEAGLLPFTLLPPHAGHLNNRAIFLAFRPDSLMYAAYPSGTVWLFFLRSSTLVLSHNGACFIFSQVAVLLHGLFREPRCSE